MNRFRRIAVACLALAGTLPLQAQETQPAPQAKSHYSTLSYLTEDHIRPEQGTIEFWIRPDVDVTQPIDRFYYFSLLRIAKGAKSWGDQGAVSIMWLQRGGLMTLASDGPRDGATKISNLPADTQKRLQWEPASWHHVALSWNGARVRLYTDGELLAETQASHPLPIASPGYIVLGHGDSRIAVDELVVSSIERSAEDIRTRMKEAPSKDEHTLLLDSMETLDTLNGRANPLRSNAAALVEGKFGQAVQLYQ